MGMAMSASATGTPVVAKDWDPDLAAGNIRVELVGIAGNQEDVEVAFGAYVRDLRMAFARRKKLPVNFIMLVVGTDVLHDDDRVANHLHRDALHDGETPVLNVTWVFSDQGVLIHESLAVRRAAIAELAEYAREGNGLIVRMLIQFSRDEIEICRQAAVQGLTQAARELSSDEVIDAFCACLGDENELVNSAAVAALAEAAAGGNDQAIQTIVDCVLCLGDQPDGVRFAVLRACLRLPDEACDERVVHALEACLQDRCIPVRDLAAQVAAQLVRRNNRHAKRAWYRNRSPPSFQAHHPRAVVV